MAAGVNDLAPPLIDILIDLINMQIILIDLINIQMTLINPLKAEFNHICHLLALLGAHHILHFSRIRVNMQIILLCKLVTADSLAPFAPSCLP